MPTVTTEQKQNLVTLLNDLQEALDDYDLSEDYDFYNAFDNIEMHVLALDIKDEPDEEDEEDEPEE